MALVPCLTCGLLVGLATWLVLAGEGAGTSGVRVHVFARFGRRAWESVASSRLVERLLGYPSFAAVADEMRTHGGRADERTVEEMASLLLLGGMGLCMAIALLSRSLLATLVAAIGLCALVHVRASSLAARKRRELSEEMPSVFRTLATALEAGSTLVQAIEYVGLKEDGPAAASFARASLGMRCGMSLEEVLGRLREELDAPGIGLMATALSISQRTGSPLRELFQRSALLVERQRELERTLAVKTAQVRMSVRVVCGLPALMVCSLALLSADFRMGLATPMGLTCVLVAMAMDGAALIIIRRIMEGVL